MLSHISSDEKTEWCNGYGTVMQCLYNKNAIIYLVVI